MFLDGHLAQALLEAMTEAVYVVDTDRTITYWNPAAEAITGWRADQVVGHRCRDGILNHVDGQGRSLCGRRCPLLRTMTDGVPRRARPFLHHQDGHRLPVVVCAAPLRDETGAITGAVEAFHDDSQFRSMAEQYADVERAALTDPLTGLGNRRMLEDELRRAAEDLQSFGMQRAVLFADVDHFKSVNDRFGHDAGDAILRSVSATMRSCCRSGDVLGRWGGEEFLLVIPAEEAAVAEVTARRLCRLVAAGRAHVGDTSLRVTISVGVAMLRRGESPAAAVRRADAAMLVAKANGRNQVHSA